MVLPTYNEIENIEKMLSTLRLLYPELSVLVVDDNSPDGTAEVVKKHQMHWPGLRLMSRQGKQGLGTAYTSGFKYALERGFDYVFEMDCDFSHDPKDLRTLLEAAMENDLVVGSRYVGGLRIMDWPVRRLLLSYFAGRYIRFVTGLKLTDATGGFKCFSRKALEKLDLDNILSNGYSFQIELNYRIWSKKMRIKEVPIVFTERRQGRSKMSGAIVTEALLTVLKLRLKNLFGSLN